jgi:hypothetical protein
LLFEILPKLKVARQWFEPVKDRVADDRTEKGWERKTGRGEIVDTV